MEDLIISGVGLILFVVAICINAIWILWGLTSDKLSVVESVSFDLYQSKLNRYLLFTITILFLLPFNFHYTILFLLILSQINGLIYVICKLIEKKK